MCLRQEKIKIGLVNLNSGAWTFLPYTSGLLQASLLASSQDPERYDFLPALWQARLACDQAVEQLDSADIVGFSLYVWNAQRSLTIAAALKKKRPNGLVLVGGPHVPDQAEVFLRENPQIDLCCHGPGEVVFSQCMEAWPEKPWKEIPGLSWIDKDGKFQHTETQARTKNLADLPSPYLANIFDSLLSAYPEQKWGALWETNRGCPFRCSYCDWGSATASKISGFEISRLYSELEWFSQHQISFVFCCDANFGILPRDLLLAEKAAEIRKETGYPVSLAVQNSKNVTERAFKVHKILIQAGLDQEVTLSVQSLSPEVLKAIKRENISLKHYRELHQSLSQEGIRTYTDVIIGLPEETYASFAEGVNQLIVGGQYHALRFFNASLLPNAEMAQPEYRERYGIVGAWVPTVYLHSNATDPPDDILEKQELVIATRTLSKQDWVRCLCFAWMTDLLFFGKHLLRPMLLYLTQRCAISFRVLIEAFLDISHEFPLLKHLSDFFKSKAESIQQGDYEYCRSEQPEYAGIWWSADEFVLIHMIQQNQIGDYFHQLHFWLQTWLDKTGLNLPDWLIQDLVAVCRLNLQLAYRIEPLSATFHSNLVEVCLALQNRENLPLNQEPCEWVKDWLGAPFSVRKLIRGPLNQ